MDEHEEGAPVSDVLRILTVFAGHEMLWLWWYWHCARCWAGAWCWWRPRSRLIGKFYKWGKWLATCEHSGQWSLWSWRHYIIDITAHTSAVSYLVTRVTLTYCVCTIITCTFHFHSAIHTIDADRGKQWWPPPIHYTLYIQTPSMTITRGQGKVLCHILNTK